MSVDGKLTEATPAAPVVGTPPKHPPVQRSLSGGDPRRRRSSSTYGTFTRVVVVAVDASDHAKRAFDWYLANVWRSDDLIVLIHCPEVPHFPVFSLKSGFNLPVEEWKKIMDDVNSGARILEEEYQSYCTIKKLKHKVRSEAMKNAGEGILRLAQEENADLIVCGSKGTGSSIFNKGSVAECIAKNSTISTLIVPAKAIVC